MKKLIAITLLTTLAACGKPAGDSAATAAADSAAPNQQRIALSYNLGVTLPENKIDVAMRADRLACENAGADKCYVMAYDFDNNISGVSANLQIRATPDWLSPFRDGHASEMQKYGGRVSSEKANAENLTRQIYDAAAQKRNKTLSRDRLYEQINQKAFRGDDLLHAQERLDGLQSEIDALSSQTAVLETRTNMSSMSITYETSRGGIDRRALAPLNTAFGKFFDIFFESLAGLIYLIAALLPFFVFWLTFTFAKNPIVRFYHKLNPKKAVESNPTDYSLP